jgi:type IV pilus assembly protein PilA
MLKNISKTVQQGFTLIELMIVIAIIGILAALAIPAYQDYLIRSQASEGLAMASAAKASVAEYYANKGAWPSGNIAAGIGSSATIMGKYVSALTINQGTIDVYYGNAANAKNLYHTHVGLQPGASPNGDVIWRCGKAGNPSGWGSDIGTVDASTDHDDTWKIPALRLSPVRVESAIGPLRFECATGAPAQCGGSFFGSASMARTRDGKRTAVCGV